MSNNYFIASLATVAMTGLALSSQAQTSNYNMVMTLAEAPTQTNSSLANTTVETFNEYTPGYYTNQTTVIGTYSSLSILAANQYGGAAGPGFATGSPYNVASASSSLSGIHTVPTYTLTFNNPIAYFGIWWSAGDPANYLTFYNGNTQVAAFSTQTLVNKLVNKSYFGNPTPGHLGQDGNERFAFINFFGVDNTVFTSVVFSNPGGSGFENDNNTIRTSAYGTDPQDDPSGKLPGVPIEEVLNVNGVQTILTDTNSIAANANVNLSVTLVPEPGTNTLFALAGVAGLALIARRRSVKA